MPITRPTLPPRAGYVEVEDENGNRIYKPTAETEEKLRLEETIRMQEEAANAEIATLQDTVDTLVLDALGIVG